MMLGARPKVVAGAVASCLIVVVLGAAPGLAQSANDDPFAGIEEMVVVGTSGAALLQTEAVSVATFDEDYLDALGANNLKDVAQFTPNLEIRSPFTASNPTLFIRGVGLRDFNANSASSVAVFNDGVYMNSPSGQLAQLFDVENIEIHRGPQGALNARNASAGAIKIISRKPSGDYGGSLKTTYGRFNEISIEGATEAPITDSLSVRVAAVWNVRDGFTRNRCADDDAWRGVTRLTPTNNPGRFVFEECFNGDTVVEPRLGGQSWFSGVAGRDGTFALSRRGVGTAALAAEPGDIDKWVNDRDNWAGRVIFAYRPTDQLTLFWNVHGGQNRGQSRQFETVGRQALDDGSGLSGPGFDADIYADADRIIGEDLQGRPIFNGDPTEANPFAGDYNNTGLEKLDLLGSSLVANLEIGDFSIESISAWEWNSRDVRANLDGSPAIGIEADYGNRAWQLSQKVHVDWSDGGALELKGGAFYLHEELSVDNVFRLENQSAVLQGYEQTTDTGALYFQAGYELTEFFDAKGGIRWNYEQKGVSIGSGPSATFPFRGDDDPTNDNDRGIPPFTPNPNFFSQESTTVDENAVTGVLELNYEPVSDVLFYIKFTRGWKGPHINGGVVGTTGADGTDLLEPARPEEVLASEFGWKTTTWDGRLKFNGALFYYDYKNLQIFQLKNEAGGVPVQVLLNAKDADVYGLELDVDVSPLTGFVPEFMEDLKIFASFAWLESEYTDFRNVRISFVQQQPIPTVEDFSGNRLINSPEFSVAAYVEWRFLTPWGAVAPRLDVSFKDEVFFNQNNFKPLSQEALVLMNLRLTYVAPSGNLELAGWVRNLTNEVYVGDAINLTNFAGKILYAIGDPRTYGVTATFSF